MEILFDLFDPLMIKRFKEFSFYFFVKLRRVSTYCDIVY